MYKEFLIDKHLQKQIFPKSRRGREDGLREMG